MPFTPSTPIWHTPPNTLFSSDSVGRRSIRLPPRSISKSSDWPALLDTTRCISEKVSIGLPLMEITRSPDLKPAAAAALFGTTSSTRGTVPCLPYHMASPAKMTMASRKFAIGHAGGVFVAKEFYIPAQWNGRELPAGAVPVGEAEELAPEPDRKHLNPNAAPSRDQEMAELVKENDDRQD